MRSVVSLACILFVAGCVQGADDTESQHGGSNLHHSKDASVEPESDAASGGDEPDASVDQIDAAATDPGKKDPPTNPKPDAGTAHDAGIAADSGIATATDAGSDASTADAGTDSGTDAGNGGGGDLDASTDAAIDSGSDDASTDAGSDASTDAGDQDAATDAGTDAGSDAGSDAGTDASAPTCTGPAGLYKDTACSVLADGIQAYTPQYPLWSDGAEKQRWIYLPPGTQIDTTNPDRWTFPKGTKFYKMFSYNGTRVETRVLEKTANDNAAGYDGWIAKSYAWNAAQDSVSDAPTGGVKGANGTPLDIPSSAQCKQCHGAADDPATSPADAPIGFNAIQLDHSLGGVMLSTLLDNNLLKQGSGPTQITLENSVIPAVTQAEREAMGYLHGNCGHCHGGPHPKVGQELWSRVNITNLSLEPMFQTAVCQCLQNWTGRINTGGDRYRYRIDPSESDLSGIVGRMSRRGQGEQMPPVGTNIVDNAGLAKVKAWIDGLDTNGCNTTGSSCPN